MQDEVYQGIIALLVTLCLVALGYIYRLNKELDQVLIARAELARANLQLREDIRTLSNAQTGKASGHRKLVDKVIKNQGVQGSE